MADTRMIRKAIRNSDGFCSLDWFARDVYMGLLLYADDYGLYDARPKILRAELYALLLDKVREADLQRALSDCERAGLVRFYEVDGKPYLQVLKYGQRCQSLPKCPVPPGYEVERLGKTEYVLKEARVKSTESTESTGSHGESQESTAYTESESKTDTNKTTTSTTSEQARTGGGADVDPYPRSAEEVAAYMRGLQLCGLRGEDLERCASKYFQDMEECGWLTKHGLPIAKWQAGAARYVTAWRVNLGKLPNGGNKRQSIQNKQLTQDDYKL